MVRAFILSLFVAFPALAQDAAGAPSPLSGLLPIVLVVVIFYFLIIRPQNAKMKQHKAMLGAIAKGDDVITGGGVHGKVTKVNDNGTLVVSIADGIDVTVERSTVSSEVQKPGADAKKDDAKQSKAA